MGQETSKQPGPISDTPRPLLNNNTGPEVSVPRAEPILVTIEGTPSDQLRTYTCYAHALAAVIYMALKTRTMDNRHRQEADALPSVSEIRGRILKRHTPDRLPPTCTELWTAATEMYPPVRWRACQWQHGPEPFEVLSQGRPVLVYLGLSLPDGIFFERFVRQNPHTVLTPSLYRLHKDESIYKYDGDEQADGPVKTWWKHALLLTGWDPATGYCTLLNSWGPGWGNNGSCQVEDINFFKSTMPDASMVCYEFYCPKLPQSTPQSTQGGSRRHMEKGLAAAKGFFRKIVVKIQSESKVWHRGQARDYN